MEKKIGNYNLGFRVWGRMEKKMETTIQGVGFGG